MTSTPPPAPLQDAISALAHDRPLTQDGITAAFDVVMRGDASPVQISALLTGLRVRGETADVVAGAALLDSETADAAHVDHQVDPVGCAGAPVVISFCKAMNTNSSAPMTILAHQLDSEPSKVM